MEENEYFKSSILDKTDWRTVLQRRLEACVMAEGTFLFPKTVKSLISAYSTVYPNWNAKKDLNKKIEELAIERDTVWDTWISEHSSSKRREKQRVKYDISYQYYHEIFEYIKDTAGSRRMLLWGSHYAPSGSPMED